MGKSSNKQTKMQAEKETIDLANEQQKLQNYASLIV